MSAADTATTMTAFESDALEDLADEITVLAAHIHAATHRLLVLIAEFDRRRGWEPGGHRSCAHWLAFRTGIDLGTAREKVRTARALLELPATSAAMAAGRLSFSQVRALTRVATPENEGHLLEVAEGATTAQLERVVRSWKRWSRRDEAGHERERHERRALSIFPDDDGMYAVRGRLEPEVGALLLRALEAASDALFRETWVPGSDGTGPDGDVGTVEAARRRRADAVGLLAERALTAGFGRGGEPPISGTRAGRYQVLLHVDADTLNPDAEPGRSELEDGTRVSAETSRRLSCDASLVRVAHGPDGSVLDVGRSRRTIPPALRRALEVRDGGCRFPGCGLRFTDGHHVEHWSDGGETSLANCLLLCRHHHRLVHEGGWRITWWAEGRPTFHDPTGHVQYDGRWVPPEIGQRPVEDLIERHRRRGLDPDWRTAGARWKRLEDIPSRILARALEAVG